MPDVHLTDQQVLERYGRPHTPRSLAITPELTAVYHDLNDACTVEMPGGQRLMMVGAQGTDQVHANRFLGLLNASKAYRIVGEYPDARATRIKITPDLIAQCIAGVHDMERVASFTKAERDRPLMMVPYGNANVVIDGYHRLARRRMDGFDHVLVHRLPHAAIQRLQVYNYDRRGDRWVWTQNDTAVDDVAKGRA